MTETEIQEPIKSLQRVIRNNATGLYFVESGGGAWVGSLDAATPYNRLAEMVEVCRQHGLADVELVIRPLE